MTARTKATGALIDAHLMMVGKLVNNAAICDAILFSTFQIISGCDRKIAGAIYFSSESLPAKKNVIKRILIAIDNPEETAIVDRIMNATTSAHTQRNEVSHAALMATADGKQILAHNPRRQSHPKKPVTGPSLDTLLKHSSQAYLDTYLAFQELCQKRGLPPKVVLE